MRKDLSISNDIAELRNLQHFVEETAEEWSLPMKLVMNVNLVLEEVVSNVVFYAYEDDDIHVIEIIFEKDIEAITITIIDDGKEFNILDRKEFDELDKSAEERMIGGLGIHFVKTLMDDVHYKREDGKNILTLTKKI